MNIIKLLSHCNCDKLTPGYKGSEARQRSWIERLLLRFVPHFDIVKTIPGPLCGGNPTEATVLYLRRFYLFRSKWFGYNFGDLYLHQIVRSDDDPDPHDHPWGFFGLVLKGGYVDERWEWGAYRFADAHGQKGTRLGPWLEVVKPLRFIFRRATHTHRVLLNAGEQGEAKPAWTLIFTSGYKRDWNFLTKDGPVFWRHYLGIPDDIDVGE